MINQLKVKLKGDFAENLNQSKSSLFQGVIMEHVSPDFAESAHVSDGESIHISGRRNYSQYLIKDESKEWYWIINTLTEEAYENVIEPIQGLSEIYLKHNKCTLEMHDPQLTSLSYDDLFERYYYTGEKLSKRVWLNFITPTAFKSNGEYLNMPTARLIVSGLIKKFDAVSPDTKLFDPMLMENLSPCLEISNFRIRSTRFNLEGIWIPSFRGAIEIFVKGGTNMISMVHMLADFAQYSGVGIKSAIGMGAVKYNEPGLFGKKDSDVNENRDKKQKEVKQIE